MKYQTLYRKYRPQHLDEVVGQEHILNVINNSLKKDMISHAYLFCGPRGTGKTSIAKLLAQAINCEKQGVSACGECENCRQGIEGTHPDIIEIDAASNNGVEEIRGLIEKVKYTPLLGKYKVYIIDEVHMLSQGAFNAFLKTLEEPPSHAVFILATTEIHKVLPTIISRCQRYDFNSINDEDIAKRLDFILDKENVSSETGVTKLVASLSGGALRNALTILEQAIILADEKITIQQIYETNGVVSAEQKIDLFSSLVSKDMDSLVKQIQKLLLKSVNIDRLMMDLIKGIKDSLVYTHTKNESYVDYIDLKFIKFLDKNFILKERLEVINIFLDYVDKMKFSSKQETYLELALINVFDILSQSIVSRETIQLPTSEIKKEANSVQKVKETVREPLKDEETVEKPESFNNDSNKQVIPEEELLYDSNLFDDFEEEEESVNPVDVPRETNEASLETERTDKVEEVQEVEETISKVEESDVVTEPIIEESNTKKQIIDDGMTSHDKETLIQFMVSADKNLRIRDEVLFKDIHKLKNDISWARYARTLCEGELVLSGERFVMIAVENEFEMNDLMDKKSQLELKDLSELLFNARKHVFACTRSNFSEAVKSFVELSKASQLPQAFEISYFDEEEVDDVVKEDLHLEKITALFGDQLEIVE